MQEQHQQLLKAIDLVRRDTDVNLQRYTTAVDRVRRDTAVSLQRYAAAVDVKLDLLKQDFAAERERVLQTLRSSNRFALMTASIIVGFLLLEILFLGWISVRAVHRLATRMSAWLSEHSQSIPAMLEINPMKNPHVPNGEIPEMIVFCDLPGEKVAEQNCPARWISRPPDRGCSWSNVQLPLALAQQIKDRKGLLQPH